MFLKKQMLEEDESTYPARSLGKLMRALLNEVDEDLAIDKILERKVSTRSI